MSLPSGSVIFLNSTAPNYTMVDYASATVYVWTQPTNTSATSSTTFHQVVDNISQWLPLIEVLGIVTLL